MATVPTTDPPFIACSIKRLPDDMSLAAARIAADINPLNVVLRELVSTLADSPELTPEHLAVMTSKVWRSGGVRLSVGFMETTAPELQRLILSHMNAWGEFGNIEFTLSATDPQVRISRGGGGYWSYLGTDVLSIPANEPTMNLEGFVLKTPAVEYRRVVRHETGHTLGMPHEHMRAELVARLDPAKTIQYFRSTQGWSEQEVRSQVLTPISQSSIRGTPNADQESIMCYQLPGTITIDGKPIKGGSDIDPLDRDFVAKIYPKPAPPTGPDGQGEITIKGVKYKLVATAA